MYFNKLIQPVLLVTLFMLTQFSLHAQNKMSFDDGWKFHFGHAADPSKDFKYGVATIFSKTGGAFETAIDPNFEDSD
jgi:beta-galactosidase